jgi:Family of unknown function (DUF6439)
LGDFAKTTSRISKVKKADRFIVAAEFSNFYLTFMPDSTLLSTSPEAKALADYSALELAQALTAKLSITDRDWHRLKSNRPARAQEQVATALILLLKDQPEEALLRLQQATGWLDRSISAPPCEAHGKAKQAP